MLKKQLQPFSRHVYVMSRQHFELRHLKNTLPGESIIPQVDFAENYALKQQSEIMSAHWANSSVTIYTGMVYVRDAPGKPLRHRSFAIVSDDPNHDKRAVYAFNQRKHAYVHETLPWKIEHVHCCSDDRTSQFKNRFTINNLLHHEKDYGSTADWSFFATAHGKGPKDGIGGEVKCQVWRAVLQGKEVVANAETFTNVAEQISPRITVLYHSADSVRRATEHLPERWENCKPLHGTQGYHFLKATDSSTIAYGKNSIFTDTSRVLANKEMRPVPMPQCQKLCLWIRMWLLWRPTF